MLTLNTLTSVGAGPRSSFLSPETVSLLVYLVGGNYDIFTDRSDATDTIVDNALYEILRGGMIGQLVPIVTETIPDNMLLCDGTTYQRAEYPELYDVLDLAFIVDSASFRVPDLSRRVPVGVGGDIDVGTTGGSETHALTEAEMPAHTHSYTAATAAIINGGVEAPASSATPFPSVTGSAGGGQAHNNMQPFMGVLWCIIAR